MKICFVACKKDPDHIRNQVLIASLQKIPNTELVIITNRYRSILRYIEVPIRALAARLKHNPDLFVTGFRGHDIFWLLYPSMIGKPKIFDEMVNMHDWMVNEHKKVKEGSVIIKILDGYMRWLMGRCQYILTDYPPNVELTHKYYGVPREKIIAIPMSTNEEIFYPRRPKKNSAKFEIFFYGNINPSSGLNVMLDAFKKVFEEITSEKIHIRFGTGIQKREVQTQVESFLTSVPASSITHHTWLDYRKVPNYVHEADLCLGGPFGATGQASRVISTKTFQFIAMAKATIIGKNEAHSFFVDKKNCLTATQGDAKSLTEAILWAYNNRQKLSAIGKSARELYAQHYSQDKISDILKDLIGKVASNE